MESNQIINDGNTKLQMLIWYKDPSIFYKDLYNEVPYDYQAKFMREVVNLKRVMLLSAAGIGKTKMLSAVGLWLTIVYSYMKKKSYDVLILSGSELQAKKLYEYSYTALSSHPIISKFVDGKPQKTYAKFITGSTIQALPKSLTSIQGQHVNCFDDKTEVLTANGFKLFKDITYEDNIATLNTKNDLLEYHKPLNIINKPFKGSLVKLENRFIDIMCTEDHNLYIKTQWKGWNLHPAKLHDLPFRFYIKKDCKWNGNKDSIFVLPEYYEQTKHRLYPEKIFDIELWLKFIGYYLSEGNCSFNKGQNRISIAAFDYDNKNEIYSIAETLGFNPKYCSSGIRIHNRQLYEYLNKLGKYAWTKYIPSELKQLSKENLEYLLYGLLKGDGHKDRKSMSFNLSSKQLIEDIGEIGLKCGYTVSYSNKPSYKKYFDKNNKIYTIKENYYIRLSHNNEVRFSRALSNIRKREKYNGNVYCVTVPNHIIMIRRNGSTCWIGNCVIVDEAALVDDFTLKDTNRIIGGEIANPDNKLLYIGTPTEYTSLYVEMWEDKKKYPDYWETKPEERIDTMWSRYSWSAINCPRFSKEEIERMKKELTEEDFNKFWLGVPYPVINTVVPIEQIRKLSIGYPKFLYDINKKIGKIIFGIDWGMTDKSVLVILQIIDDSTAATGYRYRLIDCLEWQGQEYDTVHDWIKYYADMYRPDFVFVDLNPKGESERCIKKLSPSGYYTQAINLGAERSTLQARMKHIFEKELIIIPQDYQALLNNIKKYTWSTNKQDDYVTALFLALKDIEQDQEEEGSFIKVGRIKRRF